MSIRNNHIAHLPIVFPEHVKLRNIKEQSQSCGDFMVWLRANEGEGW